MNAETYLGDGLYASFDGYHIWLKASNGVNVTNEVALEPAVFDALIAYEKRLREIGRAALEDRS